MLTDENIFFLHPNNKGFVDQKTTWTTARSNSFTVLLWCLLFTIGFSTAALFGSAEAPLPDFARNRPIIVASICFFTGVIATKIAYKSYASQTHLVQHGTLVVAQILSIDKTSYNEAWGSEIIYEFHAPDGKVIRGKQEGPNRPQKDEPAQKIWVLFLNETQHVAL